MKIKLISAAAPDDPLHKKMPFMPLSLLMLAGAAPEHDYRFVDMLRGEDPGLDEPADLVGISMRATAQDIAFLLADGFRARGIPVVIGGPQASCAPLEAIAHADAVAVGESELLWPRIIEDRAHGDLKNFYVCSPEPFSAPGRTVFQIFSYPSLDAMPVPARRLARSAYVFDSVFASRGCPIDCDFCTVSRLFGPKIRLRPAGDVAREIDTLGRYFYLLDDTVFGRPGVYDYYRDLYGRIAQLPRKRFWTGQANLGAAADKDGRAVIRAAAEAGLLYAAIGIESIAAQTLSESGAVRKMGVTPGTDAIARMKEHIRFIQDQGIIVSGWFVVGYESDSLDTYRRIFEFCRETHIIPAVFPVQALPGTRLYEKCRARNALVAGTYAIRHDSIDPASARQVLETEHAKAFGMRQVLRRTLFYARRFTSDRIHKMIFSIILQMRLRGGLYGKNSHEA